MTDAGPPPRKPGRPRKFGKGRHKITVRVTPERHKHLLGVASDLGRSLSEEVEVRIERSFQADFLEKLFRVELYRITAEAEGLRVLKEQLERAVAEALAEVQLSRELKEQLDRTVAEALARVRLTTEGEKK